MTVTFSVYFLYCCGDTAPTAGAEMSKVSANFRIMLVSASGILVVDSSDLG